MRAEDVLRALSVNRYIGLTERAAAMRRRNGGHSLWVIDTPPLAPAVLRSVLDYATVLFVLTVCLTAFFGKGDAIWAVLALLILSVALRVGTCLISRTVLLRAQRYKTPRCRVMRDGKCKYLFADQVVEGDILLFSPGDTVVCDTRMLSGEVEVSESYFSGKRRCIRKNSDDVVPEDSVWWERSNILFAASTVIGGSAVGVAVATGERTYAYANGGYIRVSADTDTETFRHVSRWSKNVSLWMILISVVLLFVGIFTLDGRISLDQLFLSVLALAVASMGEFLNTAATAFFACSMQLLQLETKGTDRIKSIQAVEKMGCADWLVFSSERLFLSGHLSLSSWMREDGIIVPASPDASMSNEVTQLISLMMQCSTPTQTLDGGGTRQSSNSLRAYLTALLASYPETHTSVKKAACLETVTCNSLCTAHISENDTMYAYVCGSVEDVLRCCPRIQIHGGSQLLTREMYSALMAYAREEKTHNRRTMAIARRVSPFQDLSMPAAVQNNMTFLGCFSVNNAVETNIPAWIDSCRQGGIRMAVFCEDVQSAKHIVTEIGLLTENDSVCTGIGAIADALASSDAGNLLVQIPVSDREAALCKIRNHARGTVYVGDALADLPCLKHSASIVVERGAENTAEILSRRAEGIIFHKDDPGCCPGSGGSSDVLPMLAFCRSAMANLRCASLYLLITQTLRVVLMLATILTELPLFTPVAILFLGCILDCFSVLLIAFRKPRQNIFSFSMEQLTLPGWRTGVLAAVGVGILAGLLISLSVLLCRNLSWIFDPEAIHIMQIISTVAVSLVAVYTCSVGGKSSSGRHAAAGVIHILYLLAAAAAICPMVYLAITKFAVVDFRVWLLSLLPSAVVFVMMKLYNRS